MSLTTTITVLLRLVWIVGVIVPGRLVRDVELRRLRYAQVLRILIILTNMPSVTVTSPASDARMMVSSVPLALERRGDTRSYH
jgi:hypothetical protein